MPERPRQVVPETFEVESTKPIPADAVVGVTLTMPSMAMPPTIIKLARIGPRSYRGTGAFSMAGDWQAEIGVSADGSSEVHRMAVKVR